MITGEAVWVLGHGVHRTALHLLLNCAVNLDALKDGPFFKKLRSSWAHPEGIPPSVLSLQGAENELRFFSLLNVPSFQDKGEEVNTIR